MCQQLPGCLTERSLRGTEGTDYIQGGSPSSYTLGYVPCGWAQWTVKRKTLSWLILTFLLCYFAICFFPLHSCLLFILFIILFIIFIIFPLYLCFHTFIYIHYFHDTQASIYTFHYAYLGFYFYLSKFSFL